MERRFHFLSLIDIAHGGTDDDATDGSRRRERAREDIQRQNVSMDIDTIVFRDDRIG